MTKREAKQCNFRLIGEQSNRTDKVLRVLCFVVMGALVVMLFAGFRMRFMSNEWFERGELPPVGVEFEAYWAMDDNPEWSYFKCAYLSAQNAIFINKDGEEYSYRPDYVKKEARIRPILTEREKVIEAALKAVSSANEFILGDLYDAGLLRLPEDKL